METTPSPQTAAHVVNPALGRFTALVAMAKQAGALRL